MLITCKILTFSGPGSYTDRPPQYDHMDGQEPPGRYFDESMGPPMGSQQHIDRFPDDGRRTPSTTGGSKCPCYFPFKIPMNTKLE